ncbi:MAG: class A beta-lactamase-related serine hydrolase [Bacteroidetes bacterium]|nr:MAG: class A beta-lactamase-related serine hydrolase [Bacteroidota bacterium]
MLGKRSQKGKPVNLLHILKYTYPKFYTNNTARKLTIFCLLVFSGLCGMHAQQEEKLEELLQKKLDSLCREEGFPGGTFGLVLADGSQIGLACGFSEPGTPMRPEHRMLAGSIGKTYVMAVAMQLLAEGSLDLDQPVAHYLGHLPWYHRLPNADSISIRMLLNHTSGLPRYVFHPQIWETALQHPTKVWTPEERLQHLFDQAPVHAPGKGWSYSDTGYILLGMVIEQITGNTYYREVKKRILKPLGLRHTSPSNKRRLKGLAQGYSGASQDIALPAQMVQHGKYRLNPQLEWTGGGMISTATDLARWAKLLHQGQAFPSHLLPAVQQAVDLQSGQPAQTGYGFANQIHQSPYGLIHGHAGIMPGYLSAMQYVPAYQFGIALQINADVFSGKLKAGRSVGQFLAELRQVVVHYLEQAENNSQ